MTKTCLSCDKKLSGRIDKKFCNNSCKNDFHNNTLLKNNVVEKMVSTSIRKNRKILQSLFDEGYFLFEKNQLENFGFSFNGLTGIEEGDQKILKYFCYEFSISPKGNSFELGKIVP